ncbi:MAG: hypothetical protein L6R38_009446 [Xanthoria sp. 2 TBL-2021]|nr:MAG: hypothetical protein L6R38_009446 [Xanthoria sp. 2 TBL-2021]
MALEPDKEPYPGDTRAVMKHALHMHLSLFYNNKLPETPDTQVTTEYNLETFIDKVSFKDPRDPMTVTATSLLIDFVWNVVYRKWDGDVKSLKDATSVDQPKIQEPKTGPLWRTLKGTGWCTSEASAIMDRFSASGVQYMTQIDPPNPSNHLQGGQCLHYKCCLRQLNDTTYRTKHAPDCSGQCETISADPNVLASILVDRNTIPLIHASNRPWHDNGKAPEIILEPWNGSRPFVAISHVWADGLGNPAANALPRCQMRRLGEMVQNLTGRSNIPFWLDTICVPPDNALKGMDPIMSKRQRQAQDQAIVKMRTTYEESLHVLVLDAWVMLNSFKAMTDVEKLMRIFCSGWNTRLWTYQEGALAKCISFKMKDEIYNIDEAMLRVRDSQDWSFNYTLRGPLMVQYQSLRGFRTQELGTAERIKYLMNALAFRATSVAADETVCLAALMGFNVQDILDVEDPNPDTPSKLAEARMTKFWSLFDRVPAAIVKFDGPTLTADAYEWAPSSLLLSEDRPLNAYRCLLTSTGEPASRTERGLHVRLPSLEFRSIVPLGLEFYVEDDQSQFYHFYFELQRFKDHARKYTHNHSGYHPEEICIDPQMATSSDTLAFIFDPIYEFEGNTIAKLSHVAERGILVAISRNRPDGTLDVRKLGNATRKTLQAPQHKDAQVIRDYIQKSSQHLQDYQNHSLIYPAKNNGTLLCSKGRRVGPRTWCIR